MTRADPEIIPDVLAGLRGVLPDGAVVTDAGLLGRYERDVTGRFAGRASMVARPSNDGEVAALLRLCDRRRVAVVPQGGNTGLVGGAIPLGGEVVLSLERLADVGSVDRASATVVAGAGATLEAVRGRAREAGLELPIDFAARGSATIGGMVATDAGGALTMRHGTMGDLVAGLRVVLANGVVVDHLTNRASWFDVTRLMCGSEGTLGVVTAARLRLVPLLAERVVALVATSSLEDAVSVAAVLRAEVRSLEAIDFFLAEGLELVCAHAGLPAPFPAEHGAYLLVSCAADSDPPELAAALDACAGVADVAVAQSARQCEALWAYRELHNPAINAAGVPHKLDVAVSAQDVPELIRRVDAWLTSERPGAHVVHYGHLAAGTVHVNVLGPAPDDDGVDDAVLRIVAGMGGSIAAEHGIGQAKSRWLHLARSAGEIAAMRAVKEALDPNGILNPGKLLPPAD